MPAAIDMGACIGCGECVYQCPKAAISMRGNVAIVDPSKCGECEACVVLCPVKCVKMQLTSS